MDELMKAAGIATIVTVSERGRLDALGADMEGPSQVPAGVMPSEGDDWLPPAGRKVVIGDTRIDARHPRGFYVLTRIG